MRIATAKMGLLIHLACAWAVFAQAPATLPADSAGRARDPLATRQQIVRDRMTQLEDRMFRLTEQLSKTEPEQARKMEAAIKRAQELLIRRNMDDAVQLLEEGRLTDASDRQMAVVKGLEGVLKILLEEGDNTQERKEEIDRLKDYRDRVQRLLDEERKLKARTDAVPRLARMLASIQAAIARLEALVEKQQKEIEAASAAGDTPDADTGDKLARSQKSIREETEDVGKRLEDPSGPVAPPAGEGQPEGEPGRQPPAGDSPSKPETSPAGGARQPQETPAGKSAEGREAADPPRPEKTPEGKGEEPKDEAAIEAGMRQAREDVRQAAGQMHSAENALDKQAIPEALPMQKKALESLRRALHELRKQEQETRRQLDQAEAARRQRELQKQAGDLAERMRSGQSGDPKDGEQQGDTPSGQPPGDPQQDDRQGPKDQNSQRPRPPTPGNHNVEQAEQHMRKAAEELEKNKLRDAGPEQQQAVEQLERARRELEEALDQLRREQQEEILRGLESRFRAMLAQQTLINEGTLGLDQKGQEAWTHADELKLAGLSQDQAGVADQAGQALHILKEDGTTVVFPRIVEQMREDMSSVASLLHDRKTGARTQRMQADIVTTLKELIAAIKELQKKLQSGESGGNSGPQKNPPLLPSSAELKLLRTCQERVKRQTDDFHVEHASVGALEADARRELEQIARRQQEVAEMARKMHERITGQ